MTELFFAHVDIAPASTVDSDEKPLEDKAMNTVTEELLDARLETIETRMDGRIATMEAKIDGKFAELRADMHRGFQDMTKWIIGTVVGVAAVSITIITFVLNNAPSRIAQTPPAPIVVYVQPAQGTSPAMPSAPTSETAGTKK